jgi:DNA-directed RNA polymerase III subunit RPC3
MSKDLPYVVKAGEQAGGQFFVDVREARQHLLLQSILALVKSRFGQPSARIMRILLAKRFLEERSISKAAMLSGKETKERLYILLQHGFVHMQEVPKSADHAPSRTIYLWTVPVDRLPFTASERTKKILVNILERIQHERSKYRLLITKTERSDVAANPAGLLSPLERAQLEALTLVLDRLDFHISRIILEYVLYVNQ